MHFMLMLLLIILMPPVFAEEDFDRQEILQRIQPIGKVRVEGQTGEGSNKVVVPVSKPAVAQSPGQMVYEAHCVVCHRDGVAGAPKFRNEAEWKPRLLKMKIEGLTASVINGLNAMPPKGTCNECSNEDLTHAIQYMLPQS